MTDWREVEARVFMTTGKRLNVVMVRGEGCRLFDEDGKSYLDFFGGTATTSLGHAHPVLADALADQARTLILRPNLIYTVPQLQLAELLVEHSCFDRVYFANSGAEANEAAIKLARKWGRERKNGAFEVIATHDAFHGRTLTTVTASGTAKYKDPFAPLPEGFVHVPFNDIDAIKRATTRTHRRHPARADPGRGRRNVPDDDYLPARASLVRRTEHPAHPRRDADGHRPLRGALRVRAVRHRAGHHDAREGHRVGRAADAVLAKEHCAVFTPGDHGSTYGGNPLATRAGYEVTKYIIDNDLPAKAADDGQWLEARLRSIEDRFQLVTEVRGKGLLWALGLSREAGAEIVQRCLDRGLVLNNVRPDAVRLCPPLIVSREELDEGLSMLEGVLSELESGAPK